MTLWGRRLRKGLLHRVHRGVYRDGHVAPSFEARYRAAVLACGEPSGLAGFAAAYCWRMSLDPFARLCHEAQVRHRATAAKVYASLARRRNAPGATNVHEVLRGDAQVTLSKLERVFLSLLEEAGLPLPETNRPAGGRYNYGDVTEDEDQVLAEMRTALWAEG